MYNKLKEYNFIFINFICYIIAKCMLSVIKSSRSFGSIFDSCY